VYFKVGDGITELAYTAVLIKKSEKSIANSLPGFGIVTAGREVIGRGQDCPGYTTISQIADLDAQPGGLSAMYSKRAFSKYWTKWSLLASRYAMVMG
jgi:hypothetical protein